MTDRVSALIFCAFFLALAAHACATIGGEVCAAYEGP